MASYNLILMKKSFEGFLEKKTFGTVAPQLPGA
jgi:hypothetical protein